MKLFADNVLSATVLAVWFQTATRRKEYDTKSEASCLLHAPFTRCLQRDCNKVISRICVQQVL